MSSFSCPKYDFEADGCMKLGIKCVPCQPGCVLYGKAVVATPVAKNIGKMSKPVGSILKT